jgi:hypothetical protein
MGRKEEEGICSGLGSLELRRCGGEEVRRRRIEEGGVASPDLPEGNGAQKRGQVRV